MLACILMSEFPSMYQEIGSAKIPTNRKLHERAPPRDKAAMDTYSELSIIIIIFIVN